MIKKLPAFALAFCLFIGITSCENEPLEGDFPSLDPTDTTDPNDPNDPGDGDSDGGTGEYWPLAVGNNWNFQNSQSTNFSATLDDSPFNITGTTTNNGNTYYQMPSFISMDMGEIGFPPGSGATMEDNGGIRFSNGNYSQMLDLLMTVEMQGMTTTMHNTSNPLVFFQEDLEAGATWTETLNLTMNTEIMGQTQTSTQAFSYLISIIEKDVSATVNGQTFDNVVKVSVELQEDAFMTIFWLAKDVGPVYIEYIELNNVNDPSDDEWAKREITSYSLN